MKRFTETLKWHDHWFRALSAEAKMAWLYLCDHCNCVGLADINFAIMSQDCGLKITKTVFDELDGRVVDVGGGKFFIPKFIEFQYGELCDSCPPHRKIIKEIRRLGITRDSLGYDYPTTRVHSTPQEEEKDKGKDKGGGVGEEVRSSSRSNANRRPTLEEVKSTCGNIGIRESDAIWFWNKCEGNGWTNDGKPIKSYPHVLAAWKQAGYLPSQKPVQTGRFGQSTPNQPTLMDKEAARQLEEAKRL